MARSAKGMLKDEHSLGVVVLKGQNHSDKLSPSPWIGDGGGFIIFFISKNGVCKHENNLRLQP